MPIPPKQEDSRSDVYPKMGRERAGDLIIRGPFWGPGVFGT